MDDLDVPGMSADLLFAYARANQFGRDVRTQSVQDGAEELACWLAAIRLLTQTFARAYNSGAEERDTIENHAYWVRVGLLMLAGRGSKAAFDLTLMGFHTEAMTLLRTMLDGWARAVYVRVVPSAAEHWIEDLQSDPPTKAPNWRAIEDAVCQHGTDEDRQRFDQALAYWGLLNEATHPTGVGIMQSLDTGTMRTFLPEYSMHRLKVTLSLSAFVHLCLLAEIEPIAGSDSQWREQHREFQIQADSLATQLRPVLAKEAATLQARRSANPTQLTPCVRSRWAR